MRKLSSTWLSLGGEGNNLLSNRPFFIAILPYPRSCAKKKSVTKHSITDYIIHECSPAHWLWFFSSQTKNCLAWQGHRSCYNAVCFSTFSLCVKRGFQCRTIHMYMCHLHIHQTQLVMKSFAQGPIMRFSINIIQNYAIFFPNDH